MHLFPFAWKSERQPDSDNRASDCISLMLNLYTYICNWIDIIGFPDFTEGEISAHSLKVMNALFFQCDKFHFDEK